MCSRKARYMISRAKEWKRQREASKERFALPQMQMGSAQGGDLIFNDHKIAVTSIIESGGGFGHTSIEVLGRLKGVGLTIPKWAGCRCDPSSLHVGGV